MQATVAPPVSGKMFKGLCMCYAVVALTYLSVAISGYWAFGNKSAGNVMSNLAPTGMPALVPNWLIFVANMCIIIQLLAICLVCMYALLHQAAYIYLYIVKQKLMLYHHYHFKRSKKLPALYNNCRIY